MKEILKVNLKLFMARFRQQEPIQFTFLAPFPKLPELLPHKQQLFARMANHKRVPGL